MPADRIERLERSIATSDPRPRTPCASVAAGSPVRRARSAPATWRVLGLVALTVGAAARAGAADAVVRDRAGLVAALESARPGTRIRIAPGEYAGGLACRGLAGTEARPVVIAAADPAQPPRIVGGTNGIQMSDVAWLTIEDVEFRGATGNGINIDDAGTFETPSHHVTLRRVRVSDVAANGNHDGIKLSGLEDFTLDRCAVEGWGGEGIDMVGCHSGRIEGCRLRAAGGRRQDRRPGQGRDPRRRRSALPLQWGDRPGRQPRRQHRARVLPAEGRSATRRRTSSSRAACSSAAQAAVAFVGVDGAVVRFNTIHRPRRWAMRILQETVDPAFVPSRGGVFEDNVVVFRSDAWGEGGVNIGPNTAPETFRFARNVWFCEDRPERSAPALPTKEVGGVVGKDPMFRDAAGGDFALKDGSPASGRGANGRAAR